MKLTILPTFIKKYITKPSVNLNPQGFRPMEFRKNDSIEGAKSFAMQTFRIKQLSASQLYEYNEINRICTKIYNLTEGRALFPKEIVMKTYKKPQRYQGEYQDNKVSLIKQNTYLSTLIHEIGHYNHELMSRNFIKMGKKSEIKADMLNPDYSIYEKFSRDSQNLKAIKFYLGGYATSSPSEFIAEMFMAVINGRRLPQGMFGLYKLYEGPHADILYKQYQKLNLFL